MADLRKLRTFGATENGVSRATLSPVDMASRQWLAERMRTAGLDATIEACPTSWGARLTTARRC